MRCVLVPAGTREESSRRQRKVWGTAWICSHEECGRWCWLPLEALCGLSMGKHNQDCWVQVHIIASNRLIDLSPDNLLLTSWPSKALRASSERCNKPEIFSTEGYTWRRLQQATRKDGRSKALSLVFAAEEECKFCAIIGPWSSKGSGRIFRIFSSCLSIWEEIILQRKKYMLITPSNFLWKLKPPLPLDLNSFSPTLKTEVYTEKKNNKNHPSSPCMWVRRRQYWLLEGFFVVIQRSICTAPCAAVVVPNSWQRRDPESAGHRWGRQWVGFGNLSSLLCSWRSSGSRMLSAALLLVLDLFSFKVGRLLVTLSTLFYWWKNYSVCSCEFLPQRRIISSYSPNSARRSMQNLRRTFITATQPLVNKGLQRLETLFYFLASVVFLCPHRGITFRWIVCIS